MAEAEKSYNDYVETLEAKRAYDVDRTLMMAYVFMNNDELKATKTTQEEIYNVFKDIHDSAAFRNIVSQAVTQERNIITPYKGGKSIGLHIITENR